MAVKKISWVKMENDPVIFPLHTLCSNPKMQNQYAIGFIHRKEGVLIQRSGLGNNRLL